MQDQPSAAAVLDQVIAHLRDSVLPGLDARGKFELRVAISALGMVRRTLELEPRANAAELARLGALLGEAGDLETLNRRLCEQLRDGAIGADTPGLLQHL